MPIGYRCIDPFGYCARPEITGTSPTHRVDKREDYTTAVSCRYSPSSCKHYQSQAFSLMAQWARSLTHTLPANTP